MDMDDHKLGARVSHVITHACRATHKPVPSEAASDAQRGKIEDGKSRERPRRSRSRARAGQASPRSRRSIRSLSKQPGGQAARRPRSHAAVRQCCDVAR